MGLGNILKTVGQVAGTATTVAKAAVETYKIVRTATSRGVEPRPWNRHHLWQEYSLGENPMRVEIPFCFYCKAAKTEANAIEMCPGPPGWR